MAAGHKPGRMFSQVTYNCEQCQDTGYIIKTIMVPEYDLKTPVEFAVQCPKCIGKGVSLMIQESQKHISVLIYIILILANIRRIWQK